MKNSLVKEDIRYISKQNEKFNLKKEQNWKKNEFRKSVGCNSEYIARKKSKIYKCKFSNKENIYGQLAFYNYWIKNLHLFHFEK